MGLAPNDRFATSAPPDHSPSSACVTSSGSNPCAYEHPPTQQGFSARLACTHAWAQYLPIVAFQRREAEVEHGGVRG